MRRLLLVVGFSLGLGACASMDSRYVGHTLASDDIDVEKVVTVNEWAHRKGAKVIWLRYPMKPRSQPEAGDAH